MGLLTRYLTPTAGRRAGGHDFADGGIVAGPVLDDGLVRAHLASELAEVTWPDSASLWEGDGPVARDEAVKVPTIARARNVVAGTVGLLPLALAVGGERDGRGRPPAWLAQPERDVPAAHTISWTADDLFFYGIAYWRVAEVYLEGGRPMRFERIAPGRVEPVRDRTGKHIVGWKVDGHRVPRTGRGRLVVFPGLEDGLLIRAATTIRVALLLEKAAANYAREPVPASILRNTTGAHINTTKVADLLSKWRTARRTSGTAYMDALELQKVGIDPAGMQLVEARQHVALELARHCNLDAHYVNATEPGSSSMTYSNVTQERRKLVDFTLRHYLTAIEGRLSMDDVTVAGQVARFDLDDFLRGDAETRARVTQTLVQTTDREGRPVMTIDEARQREGLA